MRHIESDYDHDQDRWRTVVSVGDRFGSGDVFQPTADRIVAENLRPVLDMGCGDGRLPKHLPDGWPWIGADRSPTMLAQAPKPTVRADARALPFPDESFGAVTALWMLYHLPDPESAVAEARRLLRPGGLFVASTNSRHDSPELRHLYSIGQISFDAEIAPEMVGRHFDKVAVHSWDAPLVHLPDRDAVRDYLVGRFMPRDKAESAADTVETPLDVTKRGVLVFARRLP
ncbi:MAG: class I SAM-dependent methyltransferase [Acidimicrobiia bacterium]|nr:class I SAM-dependent methyltransferase [Acidimicrobiia bacterium]